MRNYVECCLGGDAALPEMTISTRRRLKSGDMLVLCTDGMWANLKDQDFVRFAQTSGPSVARFADGPGAPGRRGFGTLQRQYDRGGNCAGVPHESAERAARPTNCAP